MKIFELETNRTRGELEETDAIRLPSTQPIGLDKYSHVNFSICESQILIK